MDTLDWLCIGVGRLREDVEGVPVTLTPQAIKAIKVLAGGYIEALPQDVDVTLSRETALALTAIAEAGLATALRAREAARAD